MKTQIKKDKEKHVVIMLLRGRGCLPVHRQVCEEWSKQGNLNPNKAHSEKHGNANWMRIRRTSTLIIPRCRHANRRMALAQLRAHARQARQVLCVKIETGQDKSTKSLGEGEAGRREPRQEEQRALWQLQEAAGVFMYVCMYVCMCVFGSFVQCIYIYIYTTYIIQYAWSALCPLCICFVLYLWCMYCAFVHYIYIYIYIYI
jgi:hypothetical protein